MSHSKKNADGTVARLPFSAVDRLFEYTLETADVGKQLPIMAREILRHLV
jgi:hypothetical protein